MISIGLGRRVAVGAAALACIASGLLATPAAAGSKSTRSTVSVSAPAASPERYGGTCPVTVSFAAKVSLTVDGKATLAYRWLRSDGSKSAVKTFTVRGSGKRTVTLTEKATVKKDSKGWRALELLSPRKATSGKASFSVSCSKPHKPSKPSQPGPAQDAPAAEVAA